MNYYFLSEHPDIGNDADQIKNEQNQIIVKSLYEGQTNGIEYDQTSQ